MLSGKACSKRSTEVKGGCSNVVLITAELMKIREKRALREILLLEEILGYSSHG
jgi:hypothetical protein